MIKRGGLPLRGRLTLALLATLALLSCDLFDIFPPEIEIVSPKADVPYFSTLPIELKVNDNRKVENVEVFLEGASIHEFTKEPYKASLDVSGQSAGTKTFKAVVYDKAGNWAEASEKIKILVGRKITSYDGEEGDTFGEWVDIDGDYAIVGADNEDSQGDEAGAAYVFRHTGAGSWDSGTKLTAPDAQADDLFGQSVAISGDYIVVGAYGEDNQGDDAGAAYIFQRTGVNSWDSGTKITAPDAQADDRFGQSVAISGDYIVVGAHGEDNQGDDAGAAYIFWRSGTNSWDGGTKLLAPGGTVGDYFGWVVDISDDYAIVSAPYGEATYIFRRTGTNSWDSGTKLLAPGGTVGDWFGTHVGISGDYAIVGAYGEDSQGDDAGAAYIFRRTGTNSWDGGTKLLAPDGTAGKWFGEWVAINGSYAIIGAPGYYDQIDAIGAAYIFRRTGTNSWSYITKLTAPDAQADDRFGYSVSLSGDVAIVGATGGSAAGAAYVFVFR